MKHGYWQGALAAIVSGVVALSSCGGSSEKHRATEASGGQGGAGEGVEGGASSLPRSGAPASEGGAAGEAPVAGSSSAQGGAAGAGGESATGLAGASNTAGGAAAGAGGAANAGGAGNASGAANAGGAAGAGGAGDSGPVVTVEADCLAPGAESALSPTEEGLPAQGLTLWLRADRGVYATAQHRVCAWVDQSGNDFVFYENGQNRPLWGASSLGAQPAIDFDAAGRYLSVSGVLGIPATSGRTFIAMVQLVSTTGRFAAIMQGQSGTPGTYVNLDTNTFNTAGSREGVYVTNNSYDTPLATSTSPRVHVFTLSTMTPGTPVLSAIAYRVNGVSQTLTRNAGGLGNGNIENFSNAGFTLVGSGPHAVMAEAIVYDRALTLEERAAVESALAARYGLSVE